MTDDEKLKIRLAEAMGLHCTFPHLLPKEYYYKKEGFICSQIFDPEHNVLNQLAAVEAILEDHEIGFEMWVGHESDGTPYAHAHFDKFNKAWNSDAETIEAALWGALKQYTETNF